MKSALIIFGFIVVIFNLLYLFFSLFKMHSYKINSDARLHIVYTKKNIIFGILCLIIAIGNIVTLINTKNMVSILYIAMIIPFFSNIIVEVILLISDKTMLIKNKVIKFDDINKIQFKDNKIWGHLIVFYGKFEGAEHIDILVSNEGKKLIKQKIENKICKEHSV